MEKTEQNVFDWNRLENSQNGIWGIYNRQVLSKGP